ncbi:MAG TPA: DUF3089 domain-containing protein [Steroidobacteraceae bacterium]|nr:DUF3089 domain-containing protein [Steroidobacteraceae bacterium]
MSHAPVEHCPDKAVHRSRRRIAPAAFLLAALLLRPHVQAAAGERLEAPDYSQLSAWAAYPGRPSRASDAPRGVVASSEGRVPVFFIHPTTYLAHVIGNASFDTGGAVGARVDEAVLRFQASVFNGCCRIFAPRYRQASLKAITTNTPAAYAADAVAYSDVARAFARFLELNPAGPFVIASHSQGSIHALRLLQERVIGTPLQRRLVAAYVIGVALPTTIASLGLPVCRSPDATGCIVTWNTVRRGSYDRRRHETAVIWWRGRYQPIAGRPLVCVNPLDWRQDTDAPPDDNLGAVYSAGRNVPIPPSIPHLTGAWCDDGLLGVDIPFRERRHFHDVLTLMGIYHDFDYDLFYMNIRQNVSERIGAWMRRHPAEEEH